MRKARVQRELTVGKETTETRGTRLFPPTDWQAIAAIADLSDGNLRCAALAQLWPQYRHGLQVFLQQRFSLSPGDTEEALQSFILDKVLIGNMFAEADRERGQFRTFLLSALENHVRSLLRRKLAAKRLPEGGWISLDLLPEDEHPDGVPSPSRHLDQVWAEAILSEAASRMETECRLGCRMDIWGIFDGRALEVFLRGRQPVPYETLVQRSSTMDLKKARLLFHTGKRMFRRAVKTVLAELVPDSTRQEQEFEDLVAILFRT